MLIAFGPFHIVFSLFGFEVVGIVWTVEYFLEMLPMELPWLLSVSLTELHFFFFWKGIGILW